MATAPRIRTPAQPSFGGLGAGLASLGRGLRRRKERKDKEEDDLLFTATKNEVTTALDTLSADMYELGSAGYQSAAQALLTPAVEALRARGKEYLAERVQEWGLSTINANKSDLLAEERKAAKDEAAMDAAQGVERMRQSAWTIAEHLASDDPLERASGMKLKRELDREYTAYTEGLEDDVGNVMREEYGKDFSEFFLRATVSSAVRHGRADDLYLEYSGVEQRAEGVWRPWDGMEDGVVNAVFEDALRQQVGIQNGLDAEADRAEKEQAERWEDAMIPYKARATAALGGDTAYDLDAEGKDFRQRYGDEAYTTVWLPWHTSYSAAEGTDYRADQLRIFESGERNAVDAMLRRSVIGVSSPEEAVALMGQVEEYRGAGVLDDKTAGQYQSKLLDISRGYATGARQRSGDADTWKQNFGDPLAAGTRKTTGELSGIVTAPILDQARMETLEASQALGVARVYGEVVEGHYKPWWGRRGGNAGEARLLRDLAQSGQIAAMHAAEAGQVLDPDAAARRKIAWLDANDVDGTTTDKAFIEGMGEAAITEHAVYHVDGTLDIQGTVVAVGGGMIARTKAGRPAPRSDLRSDILVRLELLMAEKRSLLEGGWIATKNLTVTMQ